MIELEVGEYVRSSTGYIAKLVRKGEYIYSFDQVVTRRYGEEWDFIYPDELEDIVKHSFNLADIIEPGDYVNGRLVVGVNNSIELPAVYLYEDKGTGIETYEPATLYLYNVESIVTHEHFKEAEYRVKKNE